MKVGFKKFILCWFLTLTPITALPDFHNIGPTTEIIDLSQFNHIIYIMPKQNSNTAGEEGTKLNPFTSLIQAVAFANKITKQDEKTAILVASGNYTITETITLASNIYLYGGFSNNGKWERDIFAYPTRLIAIENKRMFVLTGSSKIDGFVFTGAKLQGKGSAIYIKSASPEISNNIFIENMSLAPTNWKPKYLHQQANDGGTICGEDHSSPIIRNNLFVENKTEIGRGAAIALNNYCSPIIINNVFIKNIAGLKDPMRSSDGGAISLFNHCQGLIENNIFISNSAIAKNDGGAIFSALWCSPVIKNNIFVDNKCDDDGGAIFIGGQEHRYGKPPDPIPPKDKFYVKILDNIFIANKNLTQKRMNPDGAVRVTMDARGEFIRNICAYNSGLQFQNSDVKISENIILDILSLTRSQNNVAYFVLTNNILLDKPSLNDNVATLENNTFIINENLKSKENFVKFIDDSFTLNSISSKFNPATYTTTLIINTDTLQNLNLKNRVIKADSQWTVIKKVGKNYIEVWGNLQDAVFLYIFPTYKIK